MKYIVTKNEYEQLEIFVFSKNIMHDCMAESIRGIKNQNFSPWERVLRTPVSAGFVTDGKCHGESISLRLKSADGDTELLNNDL